MTLDCGASVDVDVDVGVGDARPAISWLDSHVSGVENLVVSVPGHTSVCERYRGVVPTQRRIRISLARDQMSV